MVSKIPFRTKEIEELNLDDEEEIKILKKFISLLLSGEFTKKELEFIYVFFKLSIKGVQKKPIYASRRRLVLAMREFFKPKEENEKNKKPKTTNEYLSLNNNDLYDLINLLISKKIIVEINYINTKKIDFVKDLIFSGLNQSFEHDYSTKKGINEIYKAFFEDYEIKKPRKGVQKIIVFNNELFFSKTGFYINEFSYLFEKLIKNSNY